MNKYFTPDIEDIHIGYECEYHGMTTGGLYFFNENNTKDEKISIEPFIEVWYPIKCSLDPWDKRKPEEIIELLKNNQIRTPYLTKEQIETEGWKFIKKHPGTECCDFKKNKYYIDIDFDFKNKIYLRIYEGEQDNEINFFRKL
jgi:hypothetical protein